MLLVVVCALIIILCILWVHSYQHFKFEKKTHHRQTSSIFISNAVSIETQLRHLRTSYCHIGCCCHIVPVDGQEFDFFPMSFLLYLIFLALLCILVIVIEVIGYTNTVNNESIIDLLFGYSHQSYYANSFSELHGINAVSIIDYLLIYSTIFLFVWVSLFSFYRYYTTYVSLTTMQSASVKILFKKFAIYALIFSILNILQIHVYYYLFPVVIILFCVFNWFCTYKFAVMLTASIELFILSGTDDIMAAKDSNEDMLRSIIFSKNISIICCILQSINLGIFVITYDVHTLGYLSFLWSICGCILALNFCRTRQFFKYQLWKYKQHCKCICYKKVQTRTVADKLVTQKSVAVIQPHLTQHSDVVADIVTAGCGDHNHAKHAKTLVIPTPIVKSKTYSRSPDAYNKQHTKPVFKRSRTDPLTVNLYADEDNNDIDQTYTNTETLNVRMHRDTKTRIRIRSNSDPENVERDTLTKPPPPFRRSNTASLYLPPNPDIEEMIHDLEEEKSAPQLIPARNTVFTLQLPDAIEKTPSLPSTSGVSVVNHSRRYNKALELLGLTPTGHKTPSLYEAGKVTAKQSSTQSPRSKFSKLSSQLKKQITSSSRYMNMDSDEESSVKSTPVPTNTVALEIPVFPLKEFEFNSIEKRKSESVVGSVLCLHTPQIMGDIEDDWGHPVRRNEQKELEDSGPIEPNPIAKIVPNINLKMEYVKSNSQVMELSEVYLGLNMLARYGFCSRKSINSIKQLEEYSKRKNTPLTTQSNHF